MQHYDDMPKIPTITAEEAMKLSWLASSSENESRSGAALVHPERTKPYRGRRSIPGHA